MSNDPAPIKEKYDELAPEERIAAAILFQAFKDTTIGPQSEREAAEAWLRSETAALWPNVLKLPPENIERALRNFPASRHRTTRSFNPASARKAHQTRLKRGNWMKARKKEVPSATSR